MSLIGQLTIYTLSEIYTTINFTDEFRNVSVTEVGVAGWAWSLRGKQT